MRIGVGGPFLVKPLLPDASQVPANQFDWPNPAPRPYAQVFLGFVAGTSLALIASLSAVVPRAPTQFQYPARAVQQPFLYGTPSVLLQQAAPAIPANQFDWPNPQPRKWNADSFIAPNLALAAAPAAPAKPANQYDWPNPQGRRFSPDLYNWSSSLFTAVVPFSQTEWPNPIVARRLFDYTWIQSPQPTAPAATAPFNQNDWPNPVLPRRIDTTWLQSGLPYSTVGSPFRQTDWPNPRGPSFSNELRTWLQSPTVAAPAPAVPTAQYDWPNPRGPSFSVDLRSWTQTPAQTPTPIPANQFNWPNPAGAQRLSGLSWEQTPPLSLSVGAPFSQIDWPNPVRALYAVAYQGFINQSPINLGIPPFVPPPPPPPDDIHGGATIGDPYAAAIIAEQVRELNEREQHEADRRQRVRAQADAELAKFARGPEPSPAPATPTQRQSRDSAAAPPPPAPDIAAFERRAREIEVALERQQSEAAAVEADRQAQLLLLVQVTQFGPMPSIPLEVVDDEDDLEAILAVLQLL